MRVIFVHVLINQKEKAHSPPLGILFLISMLRSQCVDCELVQFSHIAGTPLDPNDLAKTLQVDADIIGIGCMINALPLLVMTLRDADVRAPLLLGGPGFQGIAEALLPAVPQASAIAVGEFEWSITAACHALCGFLPAEDVPNLVVRAGDGIYRTRSATRIRDLDAIPRAAYDAITISDYHGVPAIASRGCPFECSFCDVAPAWGRKNERHSVTRLLQDLDVLHERFGVSEVGFVDDLFILNRKWIRDFCNEKLSAGNPIRWHCTGHVNLIDEELVGRMAEAGCLSIYLGAESGSDRILNSIRKNFTASDIVRAVSNIRRHQIGVSANFLWGFPFEIVDDMIRTMSLMDRLRDLGARTSLMMLAPLASSPLYLAAPQDVTFDPTMPNVFYQDYADLKQEFRAELDRLIEGDPHVFSAFHVFKGSNIKKQLKIRDMYHSMSGLAVTVDPSSEHKKEHLFIS